MSELLIDGRGNGYTAGITQENRLMITGFTTSLEHHINKTHGDCYNFLYSQSPSAGGCFLYLKNNSENNIVLEGITIQCASAEVLTMKITETGTPVAGTDVVPANLNAGSKQAADGVFQTGNNITGLANGRIIWKHWCKGGDGSVSVNFEADIIITTNQTMTMYVQNGGIQINGFVVMAYDRS